MPGRRIGGGISPDDTIRGLAISTGSWDRKGGWQC